MLRFRYPRLAQLATFTTGILLFILGTWKITRPELSPLDWTASASKIDLSHVEFEDQNVQETSEIPELLRTSIRNETLRVRTPRSLKNGHTKA